MPKERSLLVLAHFAPTAPGAFVASLEALVARASALGWAAHLALPALAAQRTWQARLREAGWTLHGLRSPWGLRPAYVSDLAALLRHVRPAITHVHFHALSLALARLSGPSSRILAHWHNPPRAGRARIRALQAVSGAEHVAVSGHLDLLLRDALGPRARIDLIPNAIPIPAAAAAASGHDLVTVQALRPQKDHGTLLAAVALLAQRGWKGSLTWIGDGPLLDEARALAAEMGVAPRVQFLGAVEDVGPLLSRAAGFVLSTHYEGQPYALLEAMAHGLPVVASDVPGCRDLLRSEADSSVVPPRDAAALSDALWQVLRAPEEAAMRGARLRRLAIAEHDVEVWADRLCALYERGPGTPSRS